MKTKWKLIFQAFENDTIYYAEYYCYYENYFGVLYRVIKTTKQHYGFVIDQSKISQKNEYLEITDNKFDAIEKSTNYWKDNKENYISDLIEKIKSINDK